MCSIATISINTVANAIGNTMATTVTATDINIVIDIMLTTPIVLTSINIATIAAIIITALPSQLALSPPSSRRMSVPST